MGAKLKPEFPPLFPAGFHWMTLEEVRALCVKHERFAASITRRAIMEGLEKLVSNLDATGVVGELWLDGGFVTEKIDPEDVDILIRVASALYDTNSQVRVIVKWASDEKRKETHFCDSYKWIEYSKGHPLFEDNQADGAAYQSLFGFNRPPKRTPKGIIAVKLPTKAT